MFNIIVPVLQKIRKIIHICLYNILKTILPLKKNKIIIASNREKVLTGNLLWIYNELKNDKYDMKILLTEKTNMKYNFKFIINIANAKYTIIDDFFPLVYPLKIRKNAKLIQVWHAVGAFKRVGFSRLGKIGGPNEKSISHRNYTDVIVSSENIVKNYQEAFKIDKEKIHPIGVPRTDFFFEEKMKSKTIDKIYNKYTKLKNKKVILFAPTFRGNGKKTAYYPNELINIDEIYKNLNDDEVFLIKNHPFINNKINITNEQSEKIIDFTFYEDINELLLITDLLITDYSSVIFEYALLDKPIIFYVPDIEKYKESRDFYYSFEEYTYGMVCNNQKELIEAINNPKLDKQKLNLFKKKFLNMCDGKATKRFIKYIIKDN